MPGSGRYGATAFGLDGRVFVCGGADGTNHYNDLWSYDPATNQWTQHTSLPGPARREAFTFIMGNKAYVGGGQGPGVVLTDFWEYDPLTDAWTQHTDLIQGLHSSLGFSLNGRGYVTWGETSSFLFAGFVNEYDPVWDTWSFTGSAPTGVNNSVGFVIADTLYGGQGYNVMSVNTFYRCYRDLSTGTSELTFENRPEVLCTPDGVQIDLNGNPGDLVDVDLLDLKGRTIRRYTIANTADRMMLDLSDVNQGIYLLRIPVADGFFTSRVTRF